MARIVFGVLGVTSSREQLGEIQSSFAAGVSHWAATKSRDASRTPVLLEEGDRYLGHGPDVGFKEQTVLALRVDLLFDGDDIEEQLS